MIADGPGEFTHNARRTSPPVVDARRSIGGLDTRCGHVLLVSQGLLTVCYCTESIHTLQSRTCREPIGGVEVAADRLGTTPPDCTVATRARG